LEEGLAIYARKADLGSFDAVLAATAIANGARALLSADTAFASVPGLRHVVPGTPDFDRLIA
jgi:predicted nucleic acid-binding protein